MPLTQGNKPRGDKRGAESSGLRRGAATLFVLMLLGVLAATAAPVLEAALPILAVFRHFAVQLGVVSALCVLGTLLLGMRRWAILAAALSLWYAILLYSFLPLSARPTADAGPPLKVLSLNLWYRSPNHAETVRYLLDSGADVIGTVETTGDWWRSLQALDAVYPYHTDCIQTIERCGSAIFSKIPFRDFSTNRLDGVLPFIVAVTVDLQGKPVTIAELQLVNPLTGWGEKDLQTEQIAVAARFLTKLPSDLVVMGDFNSTPWSTLQQAFRAATGLDNRGRLAFTWPSWAPAVFRLPIDQIFVRGGVVARNTRSGPPVGSDHLPIEADITREGQ